MAKDQGLDLEQIKRDVTEQARALTDKASEFAREQPHAAVGIALGVGWILGNGLPPRLVMAAARMGWKAMLGGAIGTGAMGLINGDLSAENLPGPIAGALRAAAPRERSPERDRERETTSRASTTGAGAAGTRRGEGAGTTSGTGPRNGRSGGTHRDT